jgi:hypothetical protein
VARTGRVPGPAIRARTRHRRSPGLCHRGRGPAARPRTDPHIGPDSPATRPTTAALADPARAASSSATASDWTKDTAWEIMRRRYCRTVHRDYIHCSILVKPAKPRKVKASRFRSSLRTGDRIGIPERKTVESGNRKGASASARRAWRSNMAVRDDCRSQELTEPLQLPDPPARTACGAPQAVAAGR